MSAAPKPDGDRGQASPTAEHATDPGWIDSLHHYRALFGSLAAAVYTTDTAGRVLFYNSAAVELWGHAPEIGKDLWSGPWRIYWPDGTPLPRDQCPMALSIRDGRPIRGEEIIVERPDGTRRNVLPHPQPLHDPTGRIIGAANMLVDITERRRTERALRQSERRLRIMFNQAAVGITLMDEHGRILEANERACQIVGRSADELRSMLCEEITHPDDWATNKSMLDEVVNGERKEFVIEKRYRRGHSTNAFIWVSVSFTALLDDAGRPHRLVAVIEDITERRHFREELERQVRDRTQELEQVQRTLRERERLMALGTLSAGIGHDLANLLLPLRASLDALDIQDSPPSPAQLATEVGAIRRGLDYLQRLAAGLRLMALDPSSRPTAVERTQLNTWWSEVEGVLRAVLLRGAALESQIPHDLPPVIIGRAILTQTVFNLVQNAAEAKGDLAGLVIRVTAELAPQAPNRRPRVRLIVADNGPGMSPETLTRCFEPYYSTKTRAIATGLGLPLIRSHILGVGGTISCESTLGNGARFIIDLPAPRKEPSVATIAPTARITLDSQRTTALAIALLDTLHVEVLDEPSAARAQIWVTQKSTDEELQAFIKGGADRCVVVLGPPPPDAAHAHGRDAIQYCGDRPDTRTLQAAFVRALQIINTGGDSNAK